MGFESFVRSLDIFEKPVSVRYMQKNSYQTFCGGILSIIAVVMIVMFSATEVWAFVEGNTFNESTVIENLGYDNTITYDVGQN